MEKYSFDNDIKVFGSIVATFPLGIGEAFDELIKKTGDGAGQRNYYGISYCEGDKIFYYAVAEEKSPGEAEKYHYEKFIIEKGDYLASTVDNWKTKTNCIKDVFSEIIKEPAVNKTKPAIEWYKDDKEMMCLVKMN